MKPDFIDYLQHKILLGDGAIGTYLYAKGIELGKDIERLNLSEPDLIYSIHEEYIRAGSQLIETNTFGANRVKLEAAGLDAKIKDINQAGVQLAKRAAGQDVYVAGSIGPTGREISLTDENRNSEPLSEIFREQISFLLDSEVDVLLFETFTHLDELITAISTARELSDIPIIAQMAYPSHGKTSSGIEALTCGKAALKAGANVIGGNCGRGVSSLLTAMEHLSPLREQAPLSAFPNAGFPEIVGHRMVYPAEPAYMVKVLADMIKLGARLVGGCCGTTPTHINEFQQHLKIKRRPLQRSADVQGDSKNNTRIISDSKNGQFLESLSTARIPIVVELDPPTHLDVTGVIEGAKAIQESGADAISLGENPLAILRADNLSLAHLINEKLDIETIIHLTCRDRNILGLQSQVMGAHLLGIGGILGITGDPATSSDQPGTSGVFDVKSFGLLRMINLFNHGNNMAGKDMKEATNFSIGGAFSFRPSRPEVQIRRLERKVELGLKFVMTQPLFDAGEVEQMMEALSHLDILILPGIFPLISARNADFLHNEVPGISIPEALRRNLWQYDKVDDQRKCALDYTRKLMAEISGFADGLYLISPLNKWSVTAELTREIRKAGWKGSGRFSF
jgi:homocysteine S-methyltransferase